MENNPVENFVYQKKSIEQDKIVGNVFSFDDPEQHKSTRIRINKVNRILGSGSCSRWVAEVNVELENDTSTPKKTHNMVIKRYKEEGANAVLDLKQSYKNYKALKKAEIPTWDTYRINAKHKLALMTLGVKKDETLITANDHDFPEVLKANPVRVIENLDEFVKKASQILEKVAAHGYRLHPDSYGIVFKPKPDNSGVYEIDILVSDLDSFDNSLDPYYQEHYGTEIDERWNKENKDHLSAALFCIFPGSRDQKKAFDKSVMSRL